MKVNCMSFSANSKLNLHHNLNIRYDFDMLSFTLGIINPYAYRFVISESTHYYMGNKRKPLYLKMNIHKLRREIQEKIVLLDADEDWEKNCKLFQTKEKVVSRVCSNESTVECVAR